MPIKFLTAGESHGKALIGIIQGIPSGLLLSADDINADLKRRQSGYGRGSRMHIEADAVEILSGVRRGRTLGSPIALLVENKDWLNWQEIMSATPPVPSLATNKGGLVTRPRPGHADLSGAIKYDTHDIRDILERSSARETAMRVALGAIAKKVLSEFQVVVGSYVVQIEKIKISSSLLKNAQSTEKGLVNLFKKAETSVLRCPDKITTKKMISAINSAARRGDTVGGIFEVFAANLPPGLGSHIQWDQRLDARLSQALMSIQAVKGVEIGLGFEISKQYGSKVMDEIFYTKTGYQRRTNNAGGIEGGMTNGMPLILRGAMKPIPTLRKPLNSVDIKTKKPFKASYERSDVCAVPAAGVVGEAMTTLVLADAFFEKFGGDSIGEIKRNYNSYIKYISKF